MDKIMKFSEFVNENNDFEKQHDSEKILKRLLNTLPSKEKDVIIHHFGLFGEKKLTNLEMAEKFGLYEYGESYISMKKMEERIHKILMKGLERLKRRGKEFYDEIQEILYDSCEEEDEQIKDFLDSEGVMIKDFDEK